MQNKLLPAALSMPVFLLWTLLLSPELMADSAHKNGSYNMQEQTITLPAPDLRGELSTEEALEQRRSVRSYLDEPLEIEWIGQLLWAAQGITDEARGFRTAPSAGATYPLEIYLAAGKVNGLQAGFYRYVPDDHSLVMVIETDIRDELAGAALGQSPVREAPASIIIAADYDRTAQRYRDRAVRYVHMEAGHAGQNICLQAISCGLGTVIIGAFHDDQVKAVLDLPGNLDPLTIIPVGKPD